MTEALSACDTLVLENKQLTQDPRSVVFNSFVSKPSKSLDNLKTGSKSDDTEKNMKFKKKTGKPRKYMWKFEAAKEGKPRTKVVDRKNILL